MTTDPAAVRVHVHRCGPGVDPARADAAAAALARVVRVPHVERLVEIGASVSGDPLLLVGRLPFSLTRVLALRPLRLGEATTVLVPLVGALRGAHAAGVAHGRVGADAVRFDARGAPHLAGFGAALLADRLGASSFAAAVGADVEAFDALVLRLAGTGLPSLREPEALVDALFDRAEPIPLDHDAAPPVPVPAGRLVGPVAADRASVLVPPGSGWGATERIRRLLAGGPLAGVRRRTLVLAASALCLAAAAAVLLPSAHA